MPKIKLVVYLKKSSSCPYLHTIFNMKFKTNFVYSEEQFISQIKNNTPDVAVICMCSIRQQDTKELLQLNSRIGQKDLFICAKNLTLDFVCAAAQEGLNHFLCCKWKSDKIKQSIFVVILNEKIKDFIKTCYSESTTLSPHIGKLENEIIQAFPSRIGEKQMAERLGISISWLQKLNRKTFNFSFQQLVRRIWVAQCMRLMKLTNLDNTEIAMRLNYSEESSMARDFRKELGFCPTEARKRLMNHSPEELLH